MADINTVFEMYCNVCRELNKIPKVEVDIDVTYTPTGEMIIQLQNRQTKAIKPNTTLIVENKEASKLEIYNKLGIKNGTYC